MIEYYPPSRKWDYVSGQARLPGMESPLLFMLGH